MIEYYGTQPQDILFADDRSGHLIAMVPPTDVTGMLDALDDLGIAPSDLAVLSSHEVLAALAEADDEHALPDDDRHSYRRAAQFGYSMLVVYAPEQPQQRQVESLLAAEGAALIRAYGSPVSAP